MDPFLVISMFGFTSPRASASATLKADDAFYISCIPSYLSLVQHRDNSGQACGCHENISDISIGFGGFKGSGGKFLGVLLETSADDSTAGQTDCVGGKHLVSRDQWRGSAREVI